MKKILLILTLILLVLVTVSCKDDVPTVSELGLTNETGEANIRFIYPEGINLDVTDALNGMIKRFCSQNGLGHIKSSDDTLAESEEFVEVLVGRTNREESAEMADQLKAREFFIGIYGEKFLICGYDEDATVKAINHFYNYCSDFVTEGKFLSENNYLWEYPYEYDSIKVGKTDISEYTIIYSDPGGTYAEPETADKYAALRLQEQIMNRCGIIIPVENDSTEESKNEIIIGGARNGAEQDSDYSYKVKTDGGKIYISAGSVYAYTKAYDALLSEKIEKNFTAEDKNVLKENPLDSFVYVEETMTETPVGALEILGADISEYKIIHHDFGERYSGYGMHEIQAATELQKYIKYATGIELPIETDAADPTDREILVGTTNREGKEISEIDRSAYGDEGLLIKTEGTRLILCGGELRGSLYAVYTFLEEYIGCEFFTGDCEVIYLADKITIPEGLFDEQIPTLEFRDVCQKVAHDTTYAVKRKINSFYQRAFNYYTGKCVKFEGGLVHTMSTVFGLGSSSRQPCFTDEEVYQKTLEKTLMLLETNPDSRVISVTQNDNNNYCNCTNCQIIIKEEESTAGPLIRFINRLADDIKEDYPKAKILTLAYMFSYAAPKTAPRDNVIIELCSLDACCGHGLGDLSCETNQEFRNNIEDWSALTDNLYVWYYVVEFTGKGVKAPFMNFDSIYDTYRLFYNNNVIGVFNEGYMIDVSCEFGALRAYLLSKLMWDPDMTKEEYDDCIRRFIAAYYGEGSDIVEEYFYMMASFARGRHFEQYSGIGGMLDLNKIEVVSDELNDWWTTLKDISYSRSATKEHIDLLFEGFLVVDAFSKGMS